MSKLKMLNFHPKIPKTNPGKLSIHTSNDHVESEVNFPVL